MCHNPLIKSLTCILMYNTIRSKLKILQYTSMVTDMQVFKFIMQSFQTRKFRMTTSKMGITIGSQNLKISLSIVRILRSFNVIEYRRLKKLSKTYHHLYLFVSFIIFVTIIIQNTKHLFSLVSLEFPCITFKS